MIQACFWSLTVNDGDLLLLERRQPLPLAPRLLQLHAPAHDFRNRKPGAQFIEELGRKAHGRFVGEFGAGCQPIRDIGCSALKYEDCRPSRRLFTGRSSSSSPAARADGVGLANRCVDPACSEQVAGFTAACSRRRRTARNAASALPLQKPPRRDPRQMRDRPVVEIGPGLARPRHRQASPAAFAGHIRSARQNPRRRPRTCRIRAAIRLAGAAGRVRRTRRHRRRPTAPARDNASPDKAGPGTAPRR